MNTKKVFYLSGLKFKITWSRLGAFDCGQTIITKYTKYIYKIYETDLHRDRFTEIDLQNIRERSKVFQPDHM